jgi:hypothetical protein
MEYRRIWLFYRWCIFLTRWKCTSHAWEQSLIKSIVLINSNNKQKNKKEECISFNSTRGKSYRNSHHKSTHLSRIQEGTKDLLRCLLTSPTIFPSKSMMDPPSSSHYSSDKYTRISTIHNKNKAMLNCRTYN